MMCFSGNTMGTMCPPIVVYARSTDNTIQLYDVKNQVYTNPELLTLVRQDFDNGVPIRQRTKQYVIRGVRYTVDFGEAGETV